MSTLKSYSRSVSAELYTVSKLRVTWFIGTLMVLAAVVSASMQWLLPVLIEIDPPEKMSGKAGEQIDSLLAFTDVAARPFQTTALDLSGTGSSSGVSMVLIALIAMVIALAAVSFDRGAATWKVLISRSRMSWALGLLTSVVLAVLAASVVSIAALTGTAVVATLLHSVDLNVDWVEVIALWGRNLLCAGLIAGAITGVILAVRRGIVAVGIVVSVLVFDVIFSTMSSFSGLSPAMTAWLPSSAMKIASGQGFVATYDPWVGIVALAGWCVLSLGIGLTSLSKAKL